jgi:L-aspartate oxidase
VDELAPRDEVARAIQHEMVSTGARSVSLDMREVNPALFPNVVAALREAGIDPERELVPVAPAAHYMMGGIATDLDARSTLPGLYAVGECSCTGVHGANRLASNSLTECFVFGARAARAAAGEESGSGDLEIAPPLGGLPVTPPSPESRQAVWRDGGLERDGEGLTRLLDDPHPLVRLIGESALARQESRGAHQRSDFPELDPGLDGRHVAVAGRAAIALALWE